MSTENPAPNAHSRRRLHGLRCAPPKAVGWVILILGIVLLFVLTQNGVPQVRNLTSSDSLHPTIFAWDFLRQNFSSAGFQFSRIPSFVPELALNVPLFWVFGDYRQPIFVYAILQSLAFFWLGGLIVSKIAGGRAIDGALLLLLAMTGVLLVDRVFPPIAHHREFFSQMGHAGTFLMSLVALLCTVALLARWRWLPAIGLFVCCFLGFVSDRLFAFVYCLPAAAGLTMLWLFKLMQWRRAVAIGACVAAGVFAAVVADHFLYRQANIGLTDIADHVARFVIGTAAFLRRTWVSATVSLAIPMLVFIGVGFWWIWRRVIVGPQSSSVTLDESDATPMFVWVFSAIAMTAVIPLTAAIYLDEGAHRYLGALLYWPILWAVIVVMWLAPQIVTPLSWAYLPAATAVILATAGHNGFAPLILRWKNPLSTCLVTQRNTFGLKAGLAEYWVARPAMVGTHFSMQVDQLTDRGEAYVWGANSTWYDRSYANPSVPPQYNFIVMSGMDEAAVRAKYGAPDRVATCDAFTFWLYDDSAALRRKLLGRAS